jgi:polar amino acid transport system ATP-binding protein
MPLLALSDISKRFGTHQALADVSLTVETSETVAIIGRSGSGKSTLLRCINGLETPDSGTVAFNGKTIGPTARQLRDIRREIGIVFQSYNLFPHLSVERNITLGPTAAKGMPFAVAQQLAQKVLGMVDLADKIAAYPRQLSGGQQQRVAIARALAMEPRLVLFDEITASLDPELIGEVVRVLEKLANDGMTMVLVTHEMGFARRSADTLVFMHQGRIWEKGPPDQLFESPRTPELASFMDAILSVNSAGAGALGLSRVVSLDPNNRSQDAQEDNSPARA